MINPKALRFLLRNVEILFPVLSRIQRVVDYLLLDYSISLLSVPVAWRRINSLRRLLRQKRMEKKEISSAFFALFHQE